MPSIRPGKVWTDTQGKPIQAHGGGVLYHDGVYYWYGENKDAANAVDPARGNLQRVDVIGVSCYSSTDLAKWTNEGVVLTSVPDEPTHDLHPSQVAERPKVIRNPATGQFVMWLHIDSPDYKKARVGVAVSDCPTGPFEYRGSFSPIGLDSRDMTLFQDDDGRAYLVFGAEWHKIVIIADLTDDYLSLTGAHSRHLPRPGHPQGREAPALFKRNGRYYLVTSGTTGWFPNPAEYATADNIHGPWTDQGDPCIGDEEGTTFQSQSTFILPRAEHPGEFLFMADRWNDQNLRDSRYVWLPIAFTPEGHMTISWRDEWTLTP